MKTKRVKVTPKNPEKGKGYELMGFDLESIANILFGLGAIEIILDINSFYDRKESEMICGDTLFVKFVGNAGPGIVALCNKSLKLPQPDEIEFDKNNNWYRFWWN